MQIIQLLLDSCLGMAVGVNRSDGCCLWDRHGLWVAVERGAAAEHKGVAAMGIHGIQQASTAIHVHIPVAKGCSCGNNRYFFACSR